MTWTDSQLIERITQWTLDNMVNRTDVWGVYKLYKTGDGVEHNQFTAPAKAMRGKVSLSRQNVVDHWKGTTSLGLHSTSSDDQCRWLAFDIDAHDDTQDVAAVNFNNALAIVSILANHGIHTIIEDSNGKGGIHVWAIFTTQHPSEQMHRFGKSILAEAGIACEIFPKQERASQSGNGYGNYIRLPGKHYKRDHWSRVWNGNAWLAGDDALRAMLETPLNDAKLIPHIEPPAPQQVSVAAISFPSNPDRDIQSAINAVGYIPNDFDYDNWIRMGMALKSVGGEQLFPVFDQWSATSPKYDQKVTRAKWNSFGSKGDKRVGVGTLVYWAKQRGYVPTKGDTLPDNWQFSAVDGLQTMPMGKPITPASPVFELAPPDEPEATPTPEVMAQPTQDEIQTTAKPKTRYPTMDEINKDFAERSKPIVPAELPVLKGPPIYRPFPLELLPPSLADFIRYTADAKSCPKEFVALPLLSSLGAAIGLSRRIEIKSGWKEYPTIWTCILGRSGTIKTPAISAASSVNSEMQERAHYEWSQQMEKFKEEMQEYENAKKNKQSNVTKPEEPKEKQSVCKDITIEAMAIVLKNNPRGILLLSDELSGWFRSFGAYKGGRGSDKEHWLSIYSSQPININRKVGEDKHIYIPRSVVCIAGATQPETIKEILSDDMHEAGMASRMLMAYPPEMVNECNFNDVPTAIKMELDRYVKYCFSLKTVRDQYNNECAVTIPIDSDARHVWKKWHDAIGEEQLFLENKCRAVWSKALSHAARLALILHILDQADGFSQPHDPISAATVQKATQLMDWFKVEQQRIYMTLSHTQEQRDAYAVIEYLDEYGGEAPVRDIYRTIRRLRNEEIRKRTIDTLVASKIVRVEQCATHEDGGRPSQKVVLIAKPNNPKQNTYENI